MKAVPTGTCKAAQAGKIATILLALNLTACLQPAHTAPAQPAHKQVLPGSDDIDPDRLGSHKVTYKKTGGVMVVHVDRDTHAERPTIRTKVWFNTAVLSKTPDTVRHDAETMGFVSRHFGDPEQYVIDVRFEDNKFVGDLIPGKDSGYKPVKYDKAYPHGGFEPAIIFNVIRTLPLAEGYRASIPVFDLNDGSRMYWANIEVTGTEKLKLAGKTYDTLKVVSEGVRKKTLWFADGVPYPIQMETQGALGVWKVASE